MRSKRKWLTVCLMVMMTLMLLAVCIHSEEKTEKPDWVNKGAGAFPGDEGNYYFGVGLSKLPNLSLQRKEADHKARVEIATTVSVYVVSFLKDFMQDYSHYFKSEYSGSEEFIQSISEEFSEANLVGCAIINRWTDPADGTLYSLARMPKSGVDNTLVERMRQRKALFVETTKDEAIKKLAKELTKKDTSEENGKPTPFKISLIRWFIFTGGLILTSLILWLTLFRSSLLETFKDKAIIAIFVQLILIFSFLNIPLLQHWKIWLPGAIVPLFIAILLFLGNKRSDNT